MRTVSARLASHCIKTPRLWGPRPPTEGSNLFGRRRGGWRVGVESAKAPQHSPSLFVEPTVELGEVGDHVDVRPAIGQRMYEADHKRRLLRRHRVRLDFLEL